ncbi:hypothetical protein [Actinomarinicola tropica]|uniref:Phosphatidate cytidylyltransferase n=1 Tax=Actinomarinicola tropica TaxID=2789776 RepID=A0A5Q2RAD7_9ACTN|nr:hypothetical protein [Actinomarinicola tropica]QGG93778.1 hypothetical protein GH723_00875 [Actinomarinicola tropica]
MSAKSSKAPSKGTAPSKATAASKSPAKRQAAGRRRARETATDAIGSYRLRQLETSRFGIVYDIDGPRVRLGVLWFFVALGCLYLGIAAVAVLFAAVAALAAAQTATVLRTKWRRPDRAVAAGVAGVVPLAAALGTGLAGAALVVATLVAVGLAVARPQKGSDPLVDAGAVVRASLAVGLAAASVVLLYRVDIGAAVTIVLLVSAYEVGDFLVGTGAANQVEGPVSGILLMAVLTAALSVLVPPPPFEGSAIWLFAAVVAVGAPLGQVLASAILPRAGAPARALRRLDSYLVAAPAWLVLMWGELHLG